jgi:hypothetical protein
MLKRLNEQFPEIKSIGIVFSDRIAVSCEYNLPKTYYDGIFSFNRFFECSHILLPDKNMKLYSEECLNFITSVYPAYSSFNVEKNLKYFKIQTVDEIRQNIILSVGYWKKNKSLTFNEILKLLTSGIDEQYRLEDNIDKFTNTLNYMKQVKGRFPKEIKLEKTGKLEYDFNLRFPIG